MARKRSGSGASFGGPQNMGQNAMMRQIQKMQEDMAAAQEALGEEMIEVSVGGGAVTVVINGHSEIQSLTINPDVIDTDDEEWVTDLQDLLMAAIKQATEQAQALSEERMAGFTGGLDAMLPPGLSGMFG